MSIPFEKLSEHLSEESSRLEIVLRGHLWVESVMNGLIEAKLRYPDALEIDRLSFANKVSLAHALGVIPPGDVGWFRKLGKLRNRLAHTLGGEPTDLELVGLETALSADTRATFSEAVGDLKGAHSRLRAAFMVMLLFMEYERMCAVWRRDNKSGIEKLGMQRALAQLSGMELDQAKIDEWREGWDVPPPPRPRDAFAPWPPGGPDAQPPQEASGNIGV